MTVMTQEQYETLVTPSVIDSVFSDEILTNSRGKWVIILHGNVVAIKGRVFYDSKEQATKAFYNSFSWKARRALWMARPDTEDTWGYWRSPDRGLMWTTFKKVLARDYGFKIQQV